jgi:nitrite reductase (NO-forming)
LRSGIAEGRMVYIGVGGAIDGKVNPILTASEGQVVQLTLINGEGAEHDIVFPDQNTKSPRVTGKGSSTTIAFRASKAGDFIYFCSVPGHQLAGMQGQFIVTTRPAPQTLVEADISREPTDLPPPVGKREPQTCGSISSASKSKGVWPRARLSATGRSTARCLGRSSACGSPTQSTFI